MQYLVPREDYDEARAKSQIKLRKNGLRKCGEPKKAGLGKLNNEKRDTWYVSRIFHCTSLKLGDNHGVGFSSTIRNRFGLLRFS